MQNPFLALRVLQARAPVVVDFEDLPFHRPHLVVVAVAPLPPPVLALRGIRTEAMVGPGCDYLPDDILALIEAERSGHLDLAACANLHLSTEEFR